MVKIIYSMGPKRPDPPGQQIITVLQNAARSVLGDSSSVVITSGTGAHGSARHRAGHAADVQFKDTNGKLVTLNDSRARQLVLAAASYGATGMGAGEEYMGPHTFHIDVYPLNQYTGAMGRAWGSWGNRLEKEFIAASGKRSGPPSSDETNVQTTESDETNVQTTESDTNFTQDSNPVESNVLSLYNPLEQNMLNENDFFKAAQEHTVPMIELENLLELFRGP